MPPRSREEIEAEAEANRRKLVASGVAALALLRRRTAEAVTISSARGQSLSGAAAALETATAGALTRGRQLSRAAGIARLEAEFAGMGVRASFGSPIDSLLYDAARARRVAQSFATRFFRRASGLDVPAERAGKVALESLDEKVKQIGITESAEAFGHGRAKELREIRVAIRLLKVFDATLDKRTCPRCSEADGTVVGIDEEFPVGRPGSIHPLCRCTETILRFDEIGRSGFITPIAA